MTLAIPADRLASLLHIAVLIYASVIYQRYRCGSSFRRIALIQLSEVTPRDPYCNESEYRFAGLAVNY